MVCISMYVCLYLASVQITINCSLSLVNICFKFCHTNAPLPMIVNRIYTSLQYLLTIHYCRHPDKNKQPEAKEKFIKINRAYEVCSTSSLLYYCMQCVPNPYILTSMFFFHLWWICLFLYDNYIGSLWWRQTTHLWHNRGSWGYP